MLNGISKMIFRCSKKHFDVNILKKKDQSISDKLIKLTKYLKKT